MKNLRSHNSASRRELGKRYLRAVVYGCGSWILALGLTSGRLHATDLSFALAAPPTAVALQFDVASNTGPITLSAPQFQGTSPHTVESAVVASGATRYVVYTTTGLPISSGGKIDVTFSTASPLTNGMISVLNVVASDASGQLVSAAPTSFPVLASPGFGYSSILVGKSAEIGGDPVDLDGGILGGVKFRRIGVGQIGSTDFAAPYSTIWTPVADGSYDLEVEATDFSGFTVRLPLGTLRAYSLAEISSYSAFESIHFGAAANPALLGFDTDPFGFGVANGIAYVLGLNPNDPDLSLLPEISVEDGVPGPGDDLVFRFTRLATLSGATWDVLESETLAGWTAVPAGWITETTDGGDLVEVEVRKPLGGPPPLSEAFMTLEATEVP